MSNGGEYSLATRCRTRPRQDGDAQLHIIVRRSHPCSSLGGGTLGRTSTPGASWRACPLSFRYWVIAPTPHPRYVLLWPSPEPCLRTARPCRYTRSGIPCYVVCIYYCTVVYSIWRGMVTPIFVWYNILTYYTHMNICHSHP